MTAAELKLETVEQDVTKTLDANIARLDQALADITARRTKLIECSAVMLATVERTVAEPVRDVKPTPKPVVKRRASSRRADLTQDEIEEIRLYATQGVSHAEIASYYEHTNISRSTVSNIVNRKGYYATV
jgi:predicted DNA-binding protein (UPF0251 family)